MMTKRSKTAPKVSKNTSKRMHNRSKSDLNGSHLSPSVARRICQPCLCSLIRCRSAGLTAPSWSFRACPEQSERPREESRRICFSLCCHPRLDRGSSALSFFPRIQHLSLSFFFFLSSSTFSIEDPGSFAFVAAPSLVRARDMPHGAFFSEVVIPSEALVLNEVKELSLAQR